MTRRAEFTVKTKLAAWKRAGGPDDPRCECNILYGGCGLPISKSDPAEYHHVEEAESGDSPERIAYLRSLENCLCVRRSCHKQITKTETMPKIVRSRRQRAGEANARAPRQKMRGGRSDKWKHKLNGKWVLR